LQVLLGVALLITKGWGAPEVERAYVRARELCRQIGDAPELPSVLWGLFQIAGNRPDFPRQSKMAEELFVLAQQNEDPTLLLVASFAVGFSFYWLGQFTLARAHAEQGLAHYDPQKHRSLALMYGQDLGVSCQITASWASCLLGYPDEARTGGQKALTVARDLGHSFTSIEALSLLTVVHQCRQEVKATQDGAEAMIELGTQQGIAFFLSWGTILRGWALAKQGQKEEGLQQMRQGLAACRATGAKVGESRWFALLAEIYAEIGQVQQAINLLADAFTHVDQTGERFYEAELHRLKGEFALRLPSSGKSNLHEAEACFQHSITVARRQHAKSWELRATTSLARLLAQHDRPDEARAILAEIYNWFTEGFDTADLKDAKALLDELAIGRE
jgi:predicted ATPase